MSAEEFLRKARAEIKRVAPEEAEALRRDGPCWWTFARGATGKPKARSPARW